MGSASIPISFQVNSNPFIVWFGNALGSVISAVVVIYIGNRLTSKPFKDKVSKHKVGKKVTKVFDEGDDNKKVQKAGSFIDKHGLRFFSLLCPIFPGVTVSTAAVFMLNLDRKLYKRWMFTGVVFVSGAYVFGYWFTVIHIH